MQLMNTHLFSHHHSTREDFVEELGKPEGFEILSNQMDFLYKDKNNFSTHSFSTTSMNSVENFDDDDAFDLSSESSMLSDEFTPNFTLLLSSTPSDESSSVSHSYLDQDLIDWTPERERRMSFECFDFPNQTENYDQPLKERNLLGPLDMPLAPPPSLRLGSVEDSDSKSDGLENEEEDRSSGTMTPRDSSGRSTIGRPQYCHRSKILLLEADDDHAKEDNDPVSTTEQLLTQFDQMNYYDQHSSKTSPKRMMSPSVLIKTELRPAAGAAQKRTPAPPATNRSWISSSSSMMKDKNMSNSNSKTQSSTQSSQDHHQMMIIDPHKNPSSSVVEEHDTTVGPKIGSYTLEERKKRIKRFLEKRKRRIWKKCIKYDCRKKLAQDRPRVKGRFVRRAEDGLPTSTTSSAESSRPSPKDKCTSSSTKKGTKSGSARSSSGGTTAATMKKKKKLQQQELHFYHHQTGAGPLMVGQASTGVSNKTPGLLNTPGMVNNPSLKMNFHAKKSLQQQPPYHYKKMLQNMRSMARPPPAPTQSATVVTMTNATTMSSASGVEASKKAGLHVGAPGTIVRQM